MASVVSQTQSASQRHFCQALMESESRDKVAEESGNWGHRPPLWAEPCWGGASFWAEPRSLLPAASGRCHGSFGPGRRRWFPPPTPLHQHGACGVEDRERSGGAAGLGRLLSTEQQRLGSRFCRPLVQRGMMGSPGMTHVKLHSDRDPELPPLQNPALPFRRNQISPGRGRVWKRENSSWKEVFKVLWA